MFADSGRRARLASCEFSRRNADVSSGGLLERSGIELLEWSPISVRRRSTTRITRRVLCLSDGVPGASSQNDRSVVDNNIAYRNGKFGIHECCTKAFTGKCNLYNNNLLYGNPTNIELQTGSDHNTKIADPLFVNYTGDLSGDYHLQPASPGINLGRMSDSNASCGMSVDFPRFDFAGNTRPHAAGKTAFDVGAYESSP